MVFEAGHWLEAVITCSGGAYAATLQAEQTKAEERQAAISAGTASMTGECAAVTICCAAEAS